MMANLYIKRITIEKSIKTYELRSIHTSKSLPSTSLNISSSTSLVSFTYDQKFIDFDRMNSYLSLFNINPSLIKYKLYLINNSTPEVSYLDIESNEVKTIVLPSVLVCGQVNIPSNTQTLLKANLQLNDPNGTDRQYADGIYNQCVLKREIGVHNITGHSLAVLSIKMKPGSSIGFLIKPEPFSEFIIYVTFITLWMGFLVLAIQCINAIYKIFNDLINWLDKKF